MKEQTVYLDSSAIVKRYVKEHGSEEVRKQYLKAYAGEIKIAFNVWNVGEVLGTLDKARTLKRLSDEDYKLARKRFLLEIKRMMKLNVLTIIPLKLRILKESWAIIEKYHTYQADAIQIVSAKYINASNFMTGDKKLHEIALEEKINTTYLK